MKQLKHILALVLLALAVTLALVACNDDPVQPDTTTAEVTTAAPDDPADGSTTTVAPDDPADGSTTTTADPADDPAEGSTTTADPADDATTTVAPDSSTTTEPAVTTTEPEVTTTEPEETTPADPNAGNPGYVAGPAEVTTVNRGMTTDKKTVAVIDSINGVATSTLLSNNMALHLDATHIVPSYTGGITVGQDGRLSISGWAMLEGGQTGMYWSTNQTAWHTFVGGGYWDAEQTVLDIATGFAKMESDKVFAAKGRFGNLMADLSEYAGRSVTLYIAVGNDTCMTQIAVLPGLAIPGEGGTTPPVGPVLPNPDGMSITSDSLTVDLSAQGPAGTLSGWRTNTENPANQFSYGSNPSLNKVNNNEIATRGGAFVFFQNNVLTLSNVDLYKYDKLCIRATDNVGGMVLIIRANGTEIGRVTTSTTRYLLTDLYLPLNSELAGATVTVESQDSNTAAGFVAAMHFEGETTLGGVESDRLSDLMDYVFAGGTVKNETVMFLDPGDTKTLLFPAASILSVTDYTGTIVYEEGRDYVLNANGTITFPAGTTIPHLTSARFYNYAQGMTVEYPWQNAYGLSSLANGNAAALRTNTTYGSNKLTWWGEAHYMTMFQVNVNYTTTSEWSGYKQASNLGIYKDFVEKLVKGEDVTVVFYGDSITYGATASGSTANYAPYQEPYAILFTKALADLFGYTVDFVDPQLTLPTNSSDIHGSSSMPTAAVPAQDYVAGTRGTITFVNTSIGGWKSIDGTNLFDTALKPFLQTYGCDLFVIGFGMNDGAEDPTTYTGANVKSTVDKVLAITPDADVALVSTMVANNTSVGWYANSIGREQPLLDLAAEYRAAGVDCAVSCMTSVSQSVLTRKDFHDYSGNNINHPNDFFARIYAQTLLQCVIGYENLD